MTTSTLELIDWATCLDDLPGCERPFGDGDCPYPAASRIFWICRCRPSLSCHVCVGAGVAHLVQGLRLRFTDFECRECGLTVHGETIDELLTVVPL